MTPLTNELQPQGIRLAEKFRQRLSETFGEHIQVILFGSQARGEAKEDSDFDILVLLPNLDERTLDTLLEISWEVGFDAGKVISVIPATFDELDILSASPFFQTVQREGISV